MDFFINKGSTLPTLKLELINDGRNDYHHFMEQIQNSDIYFCMIDVDNGMKRISMQPAICEKKVLDCGQEDDCSEEYYLTYRWRERDTKVPGTYRGQFTIDMGDDLTIITNGVSEIPYGGRLIVPIREELFIHVLEGSIKK